jgi:arylsulfatase A-like enzyme
MDDLAKKGVRFENMFVTTSICAASRATLFTGLYERTHKFTFGTPPIAPKYCDASYPALLRAAGYRTGFVGKFGVSVPRDRRPVMFDYFVPLGRNPYFKKQPDGSLRHLSEIAGDRAIEFLGKQERGKPFCLSVSFNAPHAEDSDKENQYHWPKAVDGLYRNITVPPPHLSEPGVFESQPEFLKKSLNRKRWFWRWDTPEKYQKNVKAYFRMISGVDHVMGRVLAEVKRLGFDDNTVVIFSGDNGYYLGSRGFAGKWSHYEESLRVPLIIRDPRLGGERRGRVLDPMVLNVDIAATIVALAGLEVPDLYEGRSLLPLIRGEAVLDWRRDFFCEHLFDHKDIPKWEGVRAQRWVYARYFQQSPPYEFLHDLENDPRQLKNLAARPEFAGVLAEMRKRCDQLRDRYGGPYSPEKFPTLKRLRNKKKK